MRAATIGEETRGSLRGIFHQGIFVPGNSVLSGPGFPVNLNGPGGKVRKITESSPVL